MFGTSESLPANARRNLLANYPDNNAVFGVINIAQCNSKR
jgi:hypothetical protein